MPIPEADRSITIDQSDIKSHPFNPYLYAIDQQEIAREDAQIRRELRFRRRKEGKQFSKRRVIYRRPGNNA